MPNNNRTYHTLEDIQARKDELQTSIQTKNEKISILWNDLFTPKKANTKGELISNIISNSITAFDTFMLIRKLMNNYGSIFKGRKRK